MERGPWLVIGAGGLVGRHMLAALGSRGIGTYHESGPQDGERLDVTDREQTERIVDATRPAVIVLAAAEAWVERCEREPTLTRKVNVEGALNLRRAADRAAARLVTFSSEYVFAGRSEPYAEDDQVAPLNEYGRQKVKVEAIARSGLHLVCRTSGVFGFEPARKNFVLQLIDQIRSGRQITVASDQLITPTYAPALARAIVDLIDAGASGTFHVCGPRILPRVEFAAMVTEAFGIDPVYIRAVPTGVMGLAARRPLDAGLSDAKLRRALGHGLTDPATALREMAAAGV